MIRHFDVGAKFYVGLASFLGTDCLKMKRIKQIAANMAAGGRYLDSRSHVLSGANNFRGGLVAVMVCLVCPLQTFGQTNDHAGEGINIARAQPIEVSWGRPRPIIDGLGWVLGTPEKLLYWNRRVNNHHVTDPTVGQVTDYLASRNLTDVKVRVNEYAPLDEWKRLVANKSISPGWKYTFGTLTHLRYVLLPGRLIGGDEYNPYTNSVSLYSDVSTIGLAESAYAYDIHHRSHPGTYAAFQELPFVAMWHESLAKGEVLTYVTLQGDQQQMEEARRILYVRYGLQIGGNVARVFPDRSLAFQVIGAATGHWYASQENAEYHVP